MAGDLAGLRHAATQPATSHAGAGRAAASDHLLPITRQAALALAGLNLVVPPWGRPPHGMAQALFAGVPAAPPMSLRRVPGLYC